MREQGYDVGPAIIHQDNMATIASIKKGQPSSDRSRHISIKHYWLHDRLESGEIDIEYMASSDMIADFLTKPLQGEQFLRLRELLLNWRA